LIPVKPQAVVLQMVTSIAHPPETLEGWYALHQIYTCERHGVTQGDTVDATVRSSVAILPAAQEGWSAAVRLIGSVANLMVIHFRKDIDAIAEAQGAFDHARIGLGLTLERSFLSVTEAGLYHLTARMAQEAAARGGAVGDAEYASQLAERAAAERDSEHVRKRLYPPLPKAMPYVCFYPMSKRRDAGQNWYTLSLEERSRLMHSHGLTGRRYTGRVQQVITGSIGFETWEWGVTLFARDPLDIKKLVTEMRFDEVSARYAEFGDFYVGRLESGG
jgi:hydrogen peroxide-dependent heme synthase